LRVSFEGRSDKIAIAPDRSTIALRPKIFERNVENGRQTDSGPFDLTSAHVDDIREHSMRTLSYPVKNINAVDADDVFRYRLSPQQNLLIELNANPKPPNLSVRVVTALQAP
jgi:hypothetical protein